MKVLIIIGGIVAALALAGAGMILSDWLQERRKRK